uniref:Uncharacterized protein n=1 Tax=Trichobilharzia regenti TaxID=157069 RepID=A0AA85JXR0_TRIRE|nr:unnamed protein product [Trichobilharzia regenti]
MVGCENIDYIISFKSFEDFMSGCMHDFSLKDCILTLLNLRKQVYVSSSLRLIGNECIKEDTINFSRIDHVLSSRRFSSLFSTHLLWFYFFVSRKISWNEQNLLPLKFHTSVFACKALNFCGCTEASEALARKSLVDLAELNQLNHQKKCLLSTEYIDAFHLATIELSSLVFKRSVFESRKRPQGYLRPKVKVEFATILQHSWPRTQTERYLCQLLPSSSAQILAILEALSLNPGERRSLVTPKPPIDPSDWEMSEVYCELFIAAFELIYPNSSKKLVSNFMSGTRVMRKIPVDGERSSDNLINHTIALDNPKYLKWRQPDLVRHQCHYKNSVEGGDSNTDKLIASSNAVMTASCTIDSVMKLIQVLYACAQYDIFDFMSRETLSLLQKKLSEMIEEQSPKEFIQFIEVQIETLELLRAMHSAHLSKRTLTKNETGEELNISESQTVNLSKNVVQQETSNLAIGSLESDKEANANRMTPLGFLQKGILKLIQKLENITHKGDQIEITLYDSGILVDVILVLWEYCRTLCQKWYIHSRIKPEYFDKNKINFIGLLYVLSLIRATLELLNIEVADGLMSSNITFYSIWIMELFEQRIFTLHRSQETTGRQTFLDGMNINILLKVLNLQIKTSDFQTFKDFTGNDKPTVCIIDIWTNVWMKMKSIINWARETISKRMMYLQMNHTHNLEINGLSEIQVELLWFEHNIRWKLRNLEWLSWCDSNDLTNNKAEKKNDELNENLLKQCGRNFISKVFHYCLKAEVEVNDEKAKKYYQTAEKLLFTKWQNETNPLQTNEHRYTQISNDLNESQELSRKSRSDALKFDRPPPPLLVTKSGKSMVFKTQDWKPSTGESVHFYAIYGKQTFVANQKVHITDNKLTNTGVMVVSNNGSCIIKVTDLTPNEEYAFAVAAYNEKGEPLGSHKLGLGYSTKPILACTSLCFYTSLCHMIQSACRRNLLSCLNDQTMNVLWEYLTEYNDKLDDEKLTHLTGLKMKNSDAFHCSSILLKHLATCILWHCLFIQKTGDFDSNNYSNKVYLLNTQIQKIHLSEKLVIGLELSAKLNDVQLLIDFANLIYQILSYNIEMDSVTTDYAKILLRSITILLSIRKYSKHLILLDDSLNWKLTQAIIKFTFGCIQVLETLNELKGIIATLKIVKTVLNQTIKDMKPTMNQATRKRMSQVKLNSKYGRRQSTQNSDELDELLSAVKALDAHSYLITAKLSAPRVELFGYEEAYQAVACIATKPLKTSLKDVMKFNRRTIFLQLINILVERINSNQIDLIQPLLSETKIWLNHRDQVLVKACQSYEYTEVVKINDNMNATNLDRSKLTLSSQLQESDGQGTTKPPSRVLTNRKEISHLCSLLTEYYTRKARRKRLRNVCQEEWIQRSQFSLLQARIEQYELWRKWRSITVHSKILTEKKQVEWYTYYRDNIIIDYDQSLKDSFENRPIRMNFRKSVINIDRKKLDRLAFIIPQGSNTASESPQF